MFIMSETPAPMEGASAAFVDLVSVLLSKNPWDRPTWERMLDHPFWKVVLNHKTLAVQAF
jgi:serine/threonine protein kinase